jgi:hypothetical protein
VKLFLLQMGRTQSMTHIKINVLICEKINKILNGWSLFNNSYPFKIQLFGRIIHIFLNFFKKFLCFIQVTNSIYCIWQTFYTKNFFDLISISLFLLALNIIDRGNTINSRIIIKLTIIFEWKCRIFIYCQN